MLQIKHLMQNEKKNEHVIILHIYGHHFHVQTRQSKIKKDLHVTCAVVIRLQNTTILNENSCVDGLSHLITQI